MIAAPKRRVAQRFNPLPSAGAHWLTALRPLRLGFRQAPGDRSIRWHNNRRPLPDAPKQILFQCSLSGACRFQEGTQAERRVAAGQAFLVPLPSDSRYGLIYGERWESLWLTCAGDEVEAIAGSIRRRRGPVLDVCPSSVGLLVALYDRLADGEVFSSRQLSSIAYDFYMRLADEQLAASEPDVQLPTLIRQAVDLMRDRMQDPRLDVSNLAGILQVDRSHLSRQFRLYLGMAPGEHLRQLRLSRAERLLRAEHQSIEAVARQCGFRSPAHFGARFRERFGMSPGAYARSDG
jgi:AraC-like DNA-binding protein